MAGDEEAARDLVYELSIIRNMGYVDYFLIVWDSSIMRGSWDYCWTGARLGGGSLVAYTLAISNSTHSVSSAF